MSISLTPDPYLGLTIAQRYRLISRLGQGTIASVYLARHVVIDRLSAIKVVHPELAADKECRERILREARAVNRINHPNIVEITDLGEADGFVYLVMEYVPGESLRQILDRGPIGWTRAAALGFQIASALGRAHQMGVVHRDLTPSNILVVPRRDGTDVAKLTDFGLASLGDVAPPSMRPSLRSLLEDRRRKNPYADPKSEGVARTDAGADLFALGVLLYEASTGRLPHAFGSDPDEPIANAPPYFNEVIATLRTQNPEDRPRDGFEVADLLRRALEREAVFVASISGLKFPSEAPPPHGSRQASPNGKAASRLGSGFRRELGRLPFDEIGALFRAALTRIEEEEDTAGEDENDPAPPADPSLAEAIEEARKLCSTVQTVCDLVANDTRTLETVEERGRVALAEIGRKLDDVAREHSKTLGWAGTLAERRYAVRAERLSGAHPVNAVDAMVWEQAALEQEEDRAREKASRIAARMRTLKADIQRQNERLEYERVVVHACLEGRIAALRSLSMEAWLALERTASLAGISIEPDGSAPIARAVDESASPALSRE